MLLANKQDKKEAASETEISELLNLVAIKDREWVIFKCSAYTGTGLNEGMDWLVNKLSN
jgi:hypothetical protein